MIKYAILAIAILCAWATPGSATADEGSGAARPRSWDSTQRSAPDERGDEGDDGADAPGHDAADAASDGFSVARWVIQPGREEQILALFEPYVGDDRVQSDWEIATIGVEQEILRAGITTESGQTASLTIGHTLDAGLSVEITSDGEEAAAAAALLRDAVLSAESEGIWTFIEPRPRPTATGGPRVPSSVPMGAILLAVLALLLTLLRKRLSRHLLRVAPLGTEERALAVMSAVALGVWTAAWLVYEGANPGVTGRLINDGLAWTVAALGLLLLVSIRQLRSAPRSTVITLMGIVVAGALLRIFMAVNTSLGVWPYRRTGELIRRLWSSHYYHELVHRLGVEPWMTEMTHDVGLIFAVATPLALYCHGSQLLEDRRAGLFAAAIMAFFPMHIRFSHSEVLFIPSIVLSSLTFAMLHTALKDESPFWRFVGMASLAPLAGLVTVTRPLNLVFVPLMIFTAIWLVPKRIPLLRRLVAAGIVGMSGLVSYLAQRNTTYESVDELDYLQILRDGFRIFFSGENTVFRPDFTPLVISGFVLVGVVLGIRRGRARLVGFLVAWFMMFLFMHAVVTPDTVQMQARYHLHVVVPFVLLASLGMQIALENKPRAVAVVMALVVLAPATRYPFIRNVHLNDTYEYDFVRAQRSEIPEDCTVLEFSSGPPLESLRFVRMAERIRVDEQPHFFTSLNARQLGEGERGLSDEARGLLEDPPACLYYYEGLPCWFDKEEGEPIAPQCEALRAALPWTLVAETEFPNHVYNEPWKILTEPVGAPIRIALYRFEHPGGGSATTGRDVDPPAHEGSGETANREGSGGAPTIEPSGAASAIEGSGGTADDEGSGATSAIEGSGEAT